MELDVILLKKSQIWQTKIWKVISRFVLHFLRHIGFAVPALSNILGDKKFFNGEEPTNIDCAMFGHLVQFLYIPMDIPQKQFIQKQCPNLSDFVDRMRDRFWPDWDEMCKGSCMDGHRGASYEQQ